MPYIATTKRPENGEFLQAVATLEEVADRLTNVYGYSVTADDLREEFYAARSLTFPLPDGTVIVAEQTTWPDLALAAGLTFPANIGNRAEAGDEKCQSEILDIFNARDIAAH